MPIDGQIGGFVGSEFRGDAGNGNFSSIVFAMSAISQLSVDTITRPKQRLARACSIVHAISGFPANGRIFFRELP